MEFTAIYPLVLLQYVGGSDGGPQILFLGASCSKNTHVAAVAMQQKFGT
jgi:hypothetical protein